MKKLIRGVASKDTDGNIKCLLLRYILEIEDTDEITDEMIIGAFEHINALTDIFGGEHIEPWTLVELRESLKQALRRAQQ